MNKLEFYFDKNNYAITLTKYMRREPVYICKEASL